jgi:hypothetical protein
LTKLEAIEVLLEYNSSTVIDDNWWDSFKGDPTCYDAMIVLSGMNSYKAILDKYEGFYIREFLCHVLNLGY